MSSYNPYAREYRPSRRRRIDERDVQAAIEAIDTLRGHARRRPAQYADVGGDDSDNESDDDNQLLPVVPAAAAAAAPAPVHVPHINVVGNANANCNELEGPLAERARIEVPCYQYFIGCFTSVPDPVLRYVNGECRVYPIHLHNKIRDNPWLHDLTNGGIVNQFPVKVLRNGERREYYQTTARPPFILDRGIGLDDAAARRAGPAIMYFPLSGCYALSEFTILFILYRLNQWMERHPALIGRGVNVVSRLKPASNLRIRREYTLARDGSVHYIPNREMRFNGQIDGTGHDANGDYFSWERVLGIYHSIKYSFLRTFYDSLGDPADINRTEGGSDSGTYLAMVLTQNADHIVPWLKLEIDFYPMRGVRGGGKWTETIQDAVEKFLPDDKKSFLIVKNEDDDECLLYSIALGTMLAAGEKWMTQGGNEFIDPATVRARGIYHCPLKCIQNLCSNISPFTSLLDHIGFKKLQLMSIQEFREQMIKLEKEIFDEETIGYGVDVYKMDCGEQCHLYPVYMSRRTGMHGKHISLLNLDAGNGDAHFIVLTDLQKCFSGTGGKLFYNCSACNQAFYTRGMLKRHVCVTDLTSLYPGFNWNCWFKLEQKDENIVGVCKKCMLKFDNHFEFAFHNQFCMMKNKSGFRTVRCVNSKECTVISDLPYLTGVHVDMTKEEDRKRNTKLFFADFESSIDEESGLHTMMSYGLFNCLTSNFEIGYNIEEFMDKLVRYAEKYGDIYVYFHNAMKYDANFIIRNVLADERKKKWGISVLLKTSNSMQKLDFSFTAQNGRFKGKKCHIHIGDTVLFLTMSLERIVSSIKKEGDLVANKQTFSRFFDGFKRKYPDVTDEQISLILKKNIFPYKFFTTSQKLDTPIEEFARIFTPVEENVQYFSESVCVEDLANTYDLTRQVFEIFKCKTARDYHDVYLMCDVLELADVFLRSIDVLWDSHHVYLPNYIGMPAASWAAFLRHDPSMTIPLYTSTIFAEFFATMTRGGVTSAPLRYAKADATHSIIYLDVNGLYPYVMQAYPYPSNAFDWYFPPSEDKIRDEYGDYNNFLLNHLFKEMREAQSGCCLTVDLEYPKEVAIATDDYPFAPEHRIIREEYYKSDGELTDFLKDWSEKNGNAKMSSFEGLVATVYNKYQYTCHWKLLEWYMKHGLIVRKIHWGVVFDEDFYLASYIRKNISLRNARKDPLGKTVYKLMGNSIYGKTFESPFRRGAFAIVREEEQLRGIMDEGNLQSITPIDGYGWVIKLDGEEVVLNKPTFIGACVCEYAKLHMYELYYDKLKTIFPDVKLVYTDTDSFIVQVEHEPELSDTVKLFSYIKEKCPGLLGDIGGQIKSETGEDDTIDEVIALRSKVYSYKTKKGKIGKRAKGTTSAAQERELDWEAYKETLITKRAVPTHNMQFVRSAFQVSTVNLLRQSLSSNDGKRYICPDGIHTYAHGSPLIHH